ncbi:unnamed protein product [Gongylonema pulchrum]|uniref:IBB domain-containing protein n=1 Tax=Gongylonema pulchrum TaxID=637853 RepID=A0A183ENJ9_9BILA|nr:unnamed protein product [Gongylonema pulchrum]
MDESDEASPSGDPAKDAHSSDGAGSSREAQYKNKGITVLGFSGLTVGALRKRREETSIEIRKQNRDRELNKRRQIDFDADEEAESDQGLSAPAGQSLRWQSYQKANECQDRQQADHQQSALKKLSAA